MNRPVWCQTAALVLVAAVRAGSADLTALRLAQEAGQAAAAGRHDEALPKYLMASALLPQSGGLMLDVAEQLARTGQPDAALPWLQRAARMGLALADETALRTAFGPAADRLSGVLSAFAANRTRLGDGAVAFRLAEKDLIPECVAHDPADGAFYVGSLRKRKIVKVTAEGRATDFVPAARDGLWAVLGLKVDAERRELWANSCNGDDPPLDPPDPATFGRAAIFRYDLKTGRLIRRYDPVDAPARVCFNDLVLAPGGEVYATSGPDGIWRVTAATGRLERFDPAPGFFLNGIALSEDGRRLLVADHFRGVIAVDLATREQRPLAVPLDQSLAGIDGLYVWRGSLVGVQNGFRHGPDRVVQAPLDGTGVACVAVRERGHPSFDVPTAGVVVGDALYYVAGSQLDSFDDKGNIWPMDRLKESVVLRLPLREGCP